MTVNRRHFLMTAGAAAFAAPKNAPRANVVLIVANGVGSWMLGCYGNRDLATPHLDRFAQGGMRFVQSGSAVPTDQGFATLFTSQLPSQLSGTQTQAAGFIEQAGLAGLLGANGYRVGHAGAWPPAEGSVPQNPALVTNAATQFLEQQSNGSPFLLTVQYPAIATFAESAVSKNLERYKTSRFETFNYAAQPAKMATKAGAWNDLRMNLRRFAAGVTTLDEQIPALMDKLRQKGLADNTIVVFTSVSGYLLGQHGLWGGFDAIPQHTLFEHVCAVPLMWQWPGHVPPTATRSNLISTYDLVPALAAANGIKAPASAYGRSYLKIVEGKVLGKKETWPGYLFTTAPGVDSLRDNRYKIVLRGDQGPHEIYDLRGDAAEDINQYDNAAFTQVRDGMTQALNNWKARGAKQG